MVYWRQTEGEYTTVMLEARASRADSIQIKKGEEMFKFVLSVMVGGVLFPACGGESNPPGGGSGNEGEGSPPVGGEGEGEGALQPGGDGEPCGAGNMCQDGLSCLDCTEANVESVPDEQHPGETKPCEGRICTCPQWFGGRWMVEYTNVRAVDYEYDFSRGSGDRIIWGSQEIGLKQRGCDVESLEVNTAMSGWAESGGTIDPPPLGFIYRGAMASVDAGTEFIVFTGSLSADRQTVLGTCDGKYPDGMTVPATFFHTMCDFTLTRN